VSEHCSIEGGGGGFAARLADGYREGGRVPGMLAALMWQEN
jgi:hypothetical protein